MFFIFLEEECSNPAFIFTLHPSANRAGTQRAAIFYGLLSIYRGSQLDREVRGGVFGCRPPGPRESVLMEPKLLEMDDELLPQIDRAILQSETERASLGGCRRSTE